MNKIFKIPIAILGGVNLIFQIFIPIAVALIVIKFYPMLGTYSQWIVLAAGFLSSLYKAIDVAFLKE